MSLGIFLAIPNEIVCYFDRLQNDFIISKMLIFVLPGQRNRGETLMLLFRCRQREVFTLNSNVKFLKI